MWFSALLIFIFIILLIQIFMSSRENEFVGLIFPIITFVFSLSYAFLLFVCGYDCEFHNGEIRIVLGEFLITSVPTLVLIGVHLLTRFAMSKKKKKRIIRNVEY